MVRSVILAQASSSRLGESSRVLTATRTRLGDQPTFWATPCLAQARRSRLSENSWKKNLLLISPGRESAASGRPTSRLSEFANGWHVFLTVWVLHCIYWSDFFLLKMMYVFILGCVDFYERNWHAWYEIDHEFVASWCFNMKIGWMTKKRWELYEKHDYDGEIGVIPWVPWGDFMVACSVYIKIRIQVRIASRNSKGSVSLR